MYCSSCVCYTVNIGSDKKSMVHYVIWVHSDTLKQYPDHNSHTQNEKLYWLMVDFSSIFGRRVWYMDVVLISEIHYAAKTSHFHIEPRSRVWIITWEVLWALGATPRCGKYSDLWYASLDRQFDKNLRMTQKALSIHLSISTSKMTIYLGARVFVWMTCYVLIHQTVRFV